MAKLFAMEELDTSADNVEMEVMPEEGEVADVQVEVEQEVAEVSDGAESIEEGMGAADQLEEVQEVVEQAVEEGEGLDPVAAEAIRIAVEAIAARVGANPKSVYALYATENFQSASSRKANTRIALEGVGEFLKNLWAKIKSALNSLWEKVKAFWDKHISSLGRSLKALESMKEKVNQLKGSPSSELVTVPASLASIFPVKATLGLDEIAQYALRTRQASAEVSKFRMLEDTAKAAKLADINNAAEQAKNGFTIEFGTEDQPLPGGVYHKWDFKLNQEDDDGVKILTLEVEEDHGTFTGGRKDAQMDFASKDKLKTLIVDVIKDVKDLIKYRDKVVSRNKVVSNTLRAIDKEIDGMDQGQQRMAKAALRSFNLVMSKGPMIEAKLLSVQLTAVRGILGYTSVCVKNFKKA